jgi:hypothetical protein
LNVCDAEISAAVEVVIVCHGVSPRLRR